MAGEDLPGARTPATLPESQRTARQVGLGEVLLKRPEAAQQLAKGVDTFERSAAPSIMVVINGRLKHAWYSKLERDFGKEMMRLGGLV